MREEGFDSEILNSHLEKNYLMELRGEGESIRRSIFLMVLRYWMYDVYVNKSILRCLYKFCGD